MVGGVVVGGGEVVGGVVVGGGEVVVGFVGAVDGFGVAVECRRVVVVPRREVVPGDTMVVAPGTVEAGEDALVDDVGAPNVAASRIGRPALIRGGKPATATPMAAHTTSSTTMPARFVTGPCRFMAAA